jgi:predicted NAD-dependent protein-ADP-ribosyltransferase YbiA (DUF1768 family)
MSDDIERFYRKFAKDKVKFSYDEDGNLVERDKAGTVINTITLSAYRPLTLEEIAEMEKTRMEEIAIASQALDDARVILYTKMQEPDPLPSIILKLNEDILQADLGLQHARFKHKGIDIQESVRICDLDFTQLNEVRKYPDPVSFLRTSPFSIYEKYVRPTDPGKRALVSVAEAKAEAKAQSKLLGKQDVILFGLPTTNEYGFLSMRWPIELRHEGTMYKSVAQAVYAEITKHNLNPRAHAKIMSSEDGDVAYSFDDNELYKRPEARGISKKEDYWPQLYANMNCATIAKFIQYPELALRLLQTGDAILGAWETYDNEYIGIGIPIDAPTAKNPTTWTGKNTLGNILMEIRATLKKGKELKLPYASIKEKKIQKQEKAAAKAATKAATKADTKEIKEEMQVKLVDLSEPSALDGTTLQKWIEDPNHVYIGKKRVVIIDGKKFPKEHSRWVNPYEIIEDGLVDYEKRIRSLVDSNEIPVKDLLALKGKTLGCWESIEKCHGHVLNKLIKEYSKRSKATAIAPVAPATAIAPVAPVAPSPIVAPVAPAPPAPAPAAPAPIAQSKSVKSVIFQP